ncbi:MULTISPECIES: alpha/beta fold hydrolase [Chitinophagaceae]
MAVAKINGIEICYEVFGAGNEKNILLISGFGSQMIRWSEAFCRLLVDNGFRVIRFDNRDVGCSSRIENEAKTTEQLMAILQSGRQPIGAYTLNDMAKDAILLLGFLKIEKTHVVGRSMGGIIAQILASKYTQYIESLTIAMSTSQKPGLPQTEQNVMELLLSPLPDFRTERDAFFKRKIAFAKRISGSKFPIEEKEEVAMIEQEILRAPNAHIMGHICAMALSQYDPLRTSRIEVPTLVIHGSEDPIFPVACGRDIADGIAGAQLWEIKGMGHDMPEILNERIVNKITALSKIKNLEL